MMDMENEDEMQVGDVVRLKAGGEPMTIAEIRDGCDGTSHDGRGLYCWWFEGTKLCKTWLSESSVERVNG